MPRVLCCAVATLSLALAPSALAQPNWEPIPRPPAPQYDAGDIAAVNATINRFGLDFVTVGAPGNRSWLPSERNLPNLSTPNHIDDRGRVDYAYRIMRTEVVQSQYVDYVRAFRPLWLSMASVPGHVETGSTVDSRFTSEGISILGGLTVNPNYDESAVRISWRNAARFANWLHNGAPEAGTPQASDWATYMTGAYTFTDESFTNSSLGTPVTRNADARFWLPSLDEYLKAAYYDPNRYGDSEEGYWRYPDGENDFPVFGPPGEGDWGYAEDDPSWERLRAGRYPDTQSPWGLLDVLGTASEYVETPWNIVPLPDGSIFVDRRVSVGLLGAFPGAIDEWGFSGEATGIFAFRLATIVPTPSASIVLSLAGLAAVRRRRTAAVTLAATAALAAPVLAGNQLRLTQEHGYTFSEIGDVGNPGFAWDAPGPTPEVVIGGVDYRYRISTTEVSKSQWHTFITAFAPHISMLDVPPNSSALTGGLRYLGVGGNGVPDYAPPTGAERDPTPIGWRFAAIYCNWLHNGAPTQNAAYETFANGAYDISTFTTNEDGTRNDQLAHNPDAKFWIPTRDEWHKAGYWDPNRYGEGEGGWWLYPNGTDERLTFGRPEDGGETNFGMDEDAIPGVPIALGSYPAVTSPWGLLDVSGGSREWTDEVSYLEGRWRYVAGTRLFDDEGELTYGDHLGWNFHRSAIPVFGSRGLRIAAAIPSPGACAVLSLAGLAAARRRRTAAVALAATAALAAPAFAGTGNQLRLTQEHGYTFSEIGDVGNPGFTNSIPGREPRTVGVVDYRYRISTTELTTAQWAVFLNAFAPHIRSLGLPVGISYVTGGTFYQGPGPGGVPSYAALPQEANRTSQMGWRLAAIYCNWLHNGAPTTNAAYEAFANGAYDISTFTENPDGTFNDQLAHHADARFWIPTVDEWHKAGYWDPNRYGDGEGGWWLFPNGTDERLQFGIPGEGGETNFGMDDDAIPGVPIAVGSYPDVTSPWGLLDVSGGGREWLETTGAPQRDSRGVAGTQAFEEELILQRGDMLGWMFDQGRYINSAGGSLRIAAAIPSPSACAVLSLAGLAAARRRR